MTYLLIGLGGAIGTLARFVIVKSGASDQPRRSVEHDDRQRDWLRHYWLCWNAHTNRRPLSGFGRYSVVLMVGLCGGHTTFSAFSPQTLDLLRTGGTGRAAANIALSVVLCICAVWVGHVLAAQINGHAVQIAQLEIEEQG